MISTLDTYNKKLASQAHTIIMICLNSSLADSIAGTYETYYGRDYSADDTIIIKLTDTAAAELEDQCIYTVKICLNGFRRLEFNHYQGIHKLIAWQEINVKLFSFDNPREK